MSVCGGTSLDYIVVAVVQLVRALDCGSRSRGFESLQPPFSKTEKTEKGSNGTSMFNNVENYVFDDNGNRTSANVDGKRGLCQEAWRGRKIDMT